ncbi:chemotaxis protein CheA [Geomobilimonas luticola]|uniref:histidine kinase n=1 Tax=Geomobilimonas luticola TaxID=1114878 RepID=A0ABS5S805_9BACT|nr:chemotaxis protein CheA [Geomobilimonas luticola]MBT0651508.1 chemotaxis protein CheA [Geomobilimonas luticola]
MDMSPYRDLFISESREHLRAVSELIVKMEQETGSRADVDALFRAAHSLKGMAASMGYGEIAELSHRIEDIMDRVRKEELVFDGGIADLLLEGADLLEMMITDVANELQSVRDIGDLVQRLATYRPGAEGVAAADGRDNAAVAPTARHGQPSSATPLHGEPDRYGDASTVRVRTEVLDHLINITGELITNKHRLMTVGRELASPLLDEATVELSRLLRDLHTEVLLVRLVPFSTIADRFPRVVRDLAKKIGKEIVFEVDGKGIELDRGILEGLSDPLVHILRNAVDHGLESAGERRACGKPLQGRIRLIARREKDQVVVVVEDDGRGMDPARLVATAIEKRLVSPEAGRLMSAREAFMLTCIPGFSTAREVTDVSGRGVGMDAVRSTVQALGGNLTIESELGKGSSFILRLPLTIAIINVLLVRLARITVAIPVTSVQRTVELRRDLISSRGKQKVFDFDGEPLPLLSLNRVLGLPHSHAGELLSLFVSELKGRRVGLVVDGFIGQQEIFVKPLGRPLASMKGLGGGAVLGNGEVVFILDVANIL